MGEADISFAALIIGTAAGSGFINDSGRLDCRRYAQDMIDVGRRVRNTLLAALECSVYVAPLSPGLTQQELSEVGARLGLEQGEMEDALRDLRLDADYDTGRMVPESQQVMAWLVLNIPQEPDYRDWKASEFIHKEMKASVRMHGSQSAKMERSTLVELGVAAGISRLGLEAAITIDKICGHFVEKTGMISYALGHETWPLPSEQRKPSPAMAGRVDRSEVRDRAYSLVRDVIERRTDGRPSSADALEAFIDRLGPLGYDRFRLWWRQIVDEMKRGDIQTTPVSVTVLSAALVEGALTFVVQHARARGVPAFGSSDFEGQPHRWKIDELVKSAARGGADAVLDDKTRQRADWLITVRQRIHAGRMLSDHPGSIPDYRPESAREAKAVADMVVRRILDWLDRFPPGEAKA